MKNNFIAGLSIALLAIAYSCNPESFDPEDPRDDLIGTWSCSEESAIFGSYTYSVNIEKSTTDSTQIIIENFYNLNFSYSAYAIVTGSSLNLPSQTVSGYNLNGSGSISNNKINWDFIAYDGQETDTVSSIFQQ